MLKFRLFSGKNTRKMGLLVLSLLLTAAPRAWGGFEITDSMDVEISSSSGFYSIDDENEVLSIDANKLQNAVISGDGKGIVVNGSNVKLTLKDLTVSADNGTAFELKPGD
ncbi:MAG: hypothetical protein LBO82_10585, partial [Synergistaceae bacterium]|nr:hypothetical protein [Synergistaceae bacterium]